MLVEASSTGRAKLESLLQDYLEELSAFAEIPSNESGYVYPYLDFYWKDVDRHPFFIESGGQNAGFLLVRADRNPVDGSPIMEIAELYITRPFRRRGLANRAVQDACHRFPGRWRLGVIAGNTNALAFWKRLVSTLDPAHRYVSAGESPDHQHLFEFTAGKAAN